MATAHAFRYRYPKIKEGLVHEPIPLNRWGLVDLHDQPHGTYVLYRGEWYVRTFKKEPGKLISSGLDTYGIAPEKVPGEIRSMALLLT